MCPLYRPGRKEDGAIPDHFRRSATGTHRPTRADLQRGAAAARATYDGLQKQMRGDRPVGRQIEIILDHVEYRTREQRNRRQGELPLERQARRDRRLANTTTRPLPRPEMNSGSVLLALIAKPAALAGLGTPR